MGPNNKWLGLEFSGGKFKAQARIYIYPWLSMDLLKKKKLCKSNTKAQPNNTSTDHEPKLLGLLWQLFTRLNFYVMNVKAQFESSSKEQQTFSLMRDCEEQKNCEMQNALTGNILFEEVFSLSHSILVHFRIKKSLSNKSTTFFP